MLCAFCLCCLTTQLGIRTSTHPCIPVCLLQTKVSLMTVWGLTVNCLLASVLKSTFHWDIAFIKHEVHLEHLPQQNASQTNLKLHDCEPWGRDCRKMQQLHLFLAAVAGQGMPVCQFPCPKMLRAPAIELILIFFSRNRVRGLQDE